MQLTPVPTGLFALQADLPAFIVQHIPHLPEKSVLAVCSKLVALWQGAVVAYENPAQKQRLIVQHSQAALPTALAWLTLKDGMIMTNAGIDESNANGQLILLPDCYVAAAQLRQALCRAWSVRKLGVLITDSMILPLRAGVVAGAVGYAGFHGVKDQRGQADLFGRKLKTTLVDVADSLAGAAALLMGEANEQRPLCVIENAPVVFTQEPVKGEMQYPAEDDLYAPLLKAAKLVKEEK